MSEHDTYQTPLARFVLALWLARFHAYAQISAAAMPVRKWPTCSQLRYPSEPHLHASQYHLIIVDIEPALHMASTLAHSRDR